MQTLSNALLSRKRSSSNMKPATRASKLPTRPMSMSTQSQHAQALYAKCGLASLHVLVRFLASGNMSPYFSLYRRVSTGYVEAISRAHGTNNKVSESPSRPTSDPDKPMLIDYSRSMVESITNLNSFKGFGYSKLPGCQRKICHP